ncbi:GPI transamidase component [Pseudogymnoascus australis]
MATPTTDEAEASNAVQRTGKHGIDDGEAPAAAVAAIPKNKGPPPEKPRSIRIRLYVIVSFWAIVLFLGLPIWWWTTAIYRADLPLDVMMDWADGRACRPVFPLRISIDAGSLQDQEAQNLLRATQHALDDLNDFSAHHLRLQLSGPAQVPQQTPANISILPTANQNDEEVALLVRLLPGQTTEAVLQPYAPTLDIHYTPNQVPTSASSSAPLATYIATNLREIFAEEQAMIAYLLATSSSPPERSPKALAPEVAEALAKRSTRSMKYARTYHLTFSLFTPSATPSTWAIEQALEEHMKPLLDSFSAISNFTIDTQVQLYAQTGVTGDILRKEDLSGFINHAEWPLSPSIGGAPTLNFIIYIGDMEVEGGSKSWLIPQWGGVIIQPNIDDLRPAMLTFSTHLLALIGAPESLTLPLRLSTLTRVRSAGLLLKASSTLGSLARLTLALPSISIPRSVADGVSTTLAHLEAACGGLGGVAGLEHARVAEEAAERAFFEKSMVGQVYFPDEHRVAVYLPLLGPIGVPLVMAVLKEGKAWRQRRRGNV